MLQLQNSLGNHQSLLWNKRQNLVSQIPATTDLFNPMISTKFMGSLKLLFLQENYSTPPEHTPGNPPSQLWKESLYSLLVKVFSGCVPVWCVETTFEFQQWATPSTAPTSPPLPHIPLSHIHPWEANIPTSLSLFPQAVFCWDFLVVVFCRLIEWTKIHLLGCRFFGY